MVFVHGQTEIAGKVLVVPTVSTANISQLAVDLLIASLALDRQAIVDPSYFIPIVSSRDDGFPGIVTPLELYTKQNSPIAVLQQRSPVLKARKEEFVSQLLQFIQSSNPSAVLFLSGVDMSNRTDSQMITPTYQIVTTPIEASPLRTLTQLPIPTYISSTTQYPIETQRDSSQIPFIPGGGLTRRILSSIPSEQWSIPTATLLHFVLEGDNRIDAQLFAAVVDKTLALNIQQWRTPESWKDGLFGKPHDQSLYG